MNIVKAESLGDLLRLFLQWDKEDRIVVERAPLVFNLTRGESYELHTEKKRSTPCDDQTYLILRSTNDELIALQKDYSKSEDVRKTALTELECRGVNTVKV